MTHPRGARRLLPPLLAGALLLVSCGGGEGGAGGAERFCPAFAAVLTQAKGAAPADNERDADAALKVLPDDAPGAVKEYLGGVREISALSKVWENPQTGGIKAEYVDDFQRLIGVLEDTTDATARFVAERCPGVPLPESPLSRVGGTPPGGPSGQAQAPSRPAEVRVVLADGPAGSYERVTVDVGRVTATNADPRTAGGADPKATASNSLLVEVQLHAITPAANRFAAGDFRLAAPNGPSIVASALLETAGEVSSVRLGGADASQRTVSVIFPTHELVRDVRGYSLRIERDERVPAVLPFGGGAKPAYPVALPAGATGSFSLQLTPACTDRYQTTVRSANVDLDAETASTRPLGRAPRGKRWVTVVLQVTNATPAGNATCQAFSGNAGVVEMRLQADGRALSPVNERSFDKLAVGATADRVYVFEVDAGARALVLAGNSGEVLGRWTTELPPGPE